MVVSPCVPGPKGCKACTKYKGIWDPNYPQWFSSPFWPLLFPNGFTPADFVVGVIELPSSEALIISGQSGANLFKGLPNTPVLALKLDFDFLNS